MSLSLWTSLPFGYSFNEAYHTSECWFIQKINSFFSLRVLCMALFWNLGFFHIQIMSSFSTNKRQLLVCLHLSGTWQLFMRLHSVMNEWQLSSFRSFKIHHVLALFGGFFLSTNHGRRFASLPLTHTWLIESEVLPCLSHLVMIEKVGERDSLSYCHYPVIFAYYYHSLMVKCIRVSYFLVTAVKCKKQFYFK